MIRLPPIVYVSRSKLKAGAGERFEEWSKGLVDHVATAEPRLAAFHVFLDADRQHAVTLQIHPDVASMQLHMQVVRDHMRTAYGDFIEATEQTILCGPIEGPLLQAMKGATSPGATFVEAPRHAAGFFRGQEGGAH